MATGLLEPIPLQARNSPHLLHLFPIFSLQSRTQLSKTEFFKELHFFRERQSMLGYIVGCVD